jgi:hypothetical protein
MNTGTNNTELAQKPARPVSLRLLDLYDDIDNVGHLVEAVAMAKSEIGDLRQRNALGVLLMVIENEIEAVKASLDEIRESVNDLVSHEKAFEALKKAVDANAILAAVGAEKARRGAAEANGREARS